MNVKEIVIAYLKVNGYDGLCGDECGCQLDDLVCCEEDCSNCIPGYKQDCSTCKDTNICDGMKNGECVGPDK